MKEALLKGQFFFHKPDIFTDATTFQYQKINDKLRRSQPQDWSEFKISQSQIKLIGFSKRAILLFRLLF